MVVIPSIDSGLTLRTPGSSSEYWVWREVQGADGDHELHWRPLSDDGFQEVYAGYMEEGLVRVHYFVPWRTSPEILKKFEIGTCKPDHGSWAQTGPTGAQGPCLGLPKSREQRRAEELLRRKEGRRRTKRLQAMAASERRAEHSFEEMKKRYGGYVSPYVQVRCNRCETSVLSRFHTYLDKTEIEYDVLTLLMWESSVEKWPVMDCAGRSGYVDIMMVMES